MKSDKSVLKMTWYNMRVMHSSLRDTLCFCRFVGYHRELRVSSYLRLFEETNNLCTFISTIE